VDLTNIATVITIKEIKDVYKEMEATVGKILPYVLNKNANLNTVSAIHKETRRDHPHICALISYENHPSLNRAAKVSDCDPPMP